MVTEHAVEMERPYLSFRGNMIAHPLAQLVKEFLEGFYLGPGPNGDEIPPTARLRLNLAHNKLSFGEIVKTLDCVCKKPQVFAELDLRGCLEKRDDEQNPALRGI